MNPDVAHHLLSATFTQEERDYLFTHPEFNRALERSSDGVIDVRQLNQLGVRFLLTRPRPEKHSG